MNTLECRQFMNSRSILIHLLLMHPNLETVGASSWPLFPQQELCDKFSSFSNCWFLHVDGDWMNSYLTVDLVWYHVQRRQRVKNSQQSRHRRVLVMIVISFAFVTDSHRISTLFISLLFHWCLFTLHILMKADGRSVVINALIFASQLISHFQTILILS